MRYINLRFTYLLYLLTRVLTCRLLSSVVTIANVDCVYGFNTLLYSLNDIIQPYFSHPRV